ncbi:putative bifunctional diguanylate cyclase/phosphodiesterase [Pseudorhodoferax sp.]|uniref:putative bifunctional diguanylate cyclase/phosphodiesterase n=1 Tax=Pseudorhodoferax sp. TaxID=1993553 RepID=UPI002DD63AB5|nr:EAL domain-containing protein [Pseudorhodoferax sp.]
MPAASSLTARFTLRSALLLVTLAGLLLPALGWLVADGLWGSAGPDAAGARSAVLLMVALQAVCVAVLLLAVLTRRFVWPLERLVSHVESLGGQRPVAALAWPAGDELQPLAEQLGSLRQRVDELQQELRSSEASLHRAAMYDGVTNLPNRALMAELFGHEAASARRHGRSLALLHIGLDRFRTFNDTLGHGAGDELLKAMGERLAGTLRDSDFLCRGVGDEFVVLLPGPEGWDRVASAAERLLRAAEQPLELAHSGHVVSLSAGIGIAMFPHDGADFEALARAATLALDRSKTLGRGLYSFYQPRLDVALRSRIDTERELAQALERDEFELFYQPVVDAATGRLIGCEALLRWQHPQHGLLAPGAFIESARQCGLMCDIDAWVLEAACTDLARWLDNSLQPGRLALNLSVQQARNPALSEILREALQRHGLSPLQLELEVTEDAFFGEPDSVPRALARWRSLGLALTIDDFGTGYTSLSQLKRLRPERVKIDCTLVRGLPTSADDCALADAMLGTARALQIEVVAEGVENAAQRQWLLERGCWQQQGHLHGQPMPALLFEAWLSGATSPAPLATPA